jgi:hypothetical protein
MSARQIYGDFIARTVTAVHMYLLQCAIIGQITSQQQQCKTKNTQRTPIESYTIQNTVFHDNQNNKDLKLQQHNHKGGACLPTMAPRTSSSM